MMGTPVDVDCQSCITPCKAASEGVINVVPLNKLAQNQHGRISHIKSDDAEVVKKLISMGFVPGRDITIEAILSDGGPRVARMGDMTMALEFRMASCIYVDIGASQ